MQMVRGYQGMRIWASTPSRHKGERTWASDCRCPRSIARRDRHSEQHKYDGPFYTVQNLYVAGEVLNGSATVKRMARQARSLPATM